jgi:hypothetical protein
MTRLVTPAVRASYPKLFEPDINDQGKKVYSIALLIEDTPEGKAFLAQAEKLAEETGRAKFGTRYDGLRKSPAFKWAVRYDVDKYANLEPKILAYINARSYETPPGIVSIYQGPDGKPAKITDPAVVFPGVYCKASLTCYATDRSDSKSVSFGLGNVQILQNKAAERIDSRVNAEDEFVADPEAAASLDDL